MCDAAAASPEHELERPRARLEMRRGRECEVHLQGARHQEHAVDPRIAEHVEVLERATSITHVAGEVLEYLVELHRLANAERQVDIRPPVFGGNAGRACEGASGDPRIASAARQQIGPQPIALSGVNTGRG